MRNGNCFFWTEADQTVVADDLFDGFTRKGNPTPRQPDFDNLTTRRAGSEYNPSSVLMRVCPMSTSDGWAVDGNVRLLALDETFDESSTPSPTVPPDEHDEARMKRTGLLPGEQLVLVHWLLWAR